MFCKFCGKELEEGQWCLCRSMDEGNNDGTADEKEKDETPAFITENETGEEESKGFVMFEPQPEWQPPVEKKSGVLSRFASVLRHYISQPVAAIKQAGKFEDKGVGLLCCVLQAVLLGVAMCFYLSEKVQVGYQFGFFEQAVPFGEYLIHSGSSLPVLFLQLAGFILLADLFLLLLLTLFTGGFGSKKGFSKMIGSIGTSFLTGGFAGILIAALSVFLPKTGTILLFGGILISILAIWQGLRSVSELSETKLFYLFPLAFMVWLGGIGWFVSEVPMLSWIFGLL